MLKSYLKLSRSDARLRLSLIAGSVAVLMAGCAATQTTQGTSGGDPAATAPRLVKKDSTILWENAALFGQVPADLQARGNEACNAGAAKKMKAVGYHPKAMKLDGSPFPRGGFLCAEDVSAPVVAAAPKPEPKAEVKPLPAGPNLAELDARTQSWAKAWASKDLNAYFGFYSANFKPSGFANVAAWKESRTARINKTGPIAVELSNISSKNLSGGAVETRFSQNYSSANFKDTSAKSLIWANEGGQWKIVSESNR